MKKVFFMLALSLTLPFFNGCKKDKKKDGFLGTSVGGTTIVKGCTDPSAVNYNSSANTNDGSCQYNGKATFWYNSVGTTATVYMGGQSGQITVYYTSGTPTCGSATGCANFTLPTGTYNYSASSTFSTWSGQVTIDKDNCKLILLQ